MNLRPSARRRAVVVGAGLGGLSAACHLASRGWSVRVVEANHAIGGKCGRISWQGWEFDTGPSVLTMPFVLRELWADCGRRLEDYLQLEPVEPGCRYFFADGRRFDAPGNLPGMRAAIAEHFPAELAGFDRFFAWVRRLWDVSEPFFLSNPLDLNTLARIRPRHVRPALAMMRPGSVHAAVRSCFRDPALIQLFDRFATYNGSDPYRAPAAFAVIAHAEFAFGSWRCRGGMHALAQALGKLADDLGVEIMTGRPARKVRFGGPGGAPDAVELEDGAVLEADGVVVNRDAVSALTGTLLEDMPGVEPLGRRAASREASTGGFVLLLALQGRHPALATHNILFPRDYRREFHDLFVRKHAPDDPTIYISIPSRTEPSLAPEGGEGWFVLVNAPAREDAEYWKNGYEERVRGMLRDGVLGLHSDQVRWSRVLNPADFHATHGAWKGSLYGPSSNTLFAAFRRVPNRGPVPGLAFAGGSAHPGGGIPLVLLGGRMAADVLGTPR